MTNTNPQQYPTQFYGRTFIFWVGVICFGPYAVLLSILVLLFLFRIMCGDAGLDMVLASLVLLPFLLVFVSTALACIFQVYARQMPILKIFRDGMVIRSIGVQLRYGSDNLIGQYFWYTTGPIILPRIILWHCISLQAFRIRTFLFRWEDITDLLTNKNEFKIEGWCEQNRNDFKREVPLEFWFFLYESHDFGTSIRKVGESVQFFLHNPDARESLPSWQDEETLFGNETFDFR